MYLAPVLLLEHLDPLQQLHILRPNVHIDRKPGLTGRVRNLSAAKNGDLAAKNGDLALAGLSLDSRA